MQIGFGGRCGGKVKAGLATALAAMAIDHLAQGAGDMVAHRATQAAATVVVGGGVERGHGNLRLFGKA